MSKLTKRQTEILNLIESHINETGSPPTRAEIAKTMGFRSPNAAEDHLRALARKGVIELVPGTSRGIRLTRSHGIPILKSMIKQDLLSEENIEGYSRIDKNILNPGIDFLFRVPNSDFSAQGILKNDLVAINQTLNPAKLSASATSGMRAGAGGSSAQGNGSASGAGSNSRLVLVLIRSNNELMIRSYSDALEAQNFTIEGLLIGVIRALPGSSFT